MRMIKGLQERRGVHSHGGDDGGGDDHGGGGGGGGGGVRLTGDNAANTLNGSAGDDRLSGQGGDDVLNGLGGADRLDGGEGADTIAAGSGSDQVDGGAGVDWISSDNSATTGRVEVKIEDRAGDNHVDVLANAGERVSVRTGDGADTINITGGARVDVRSGEGADVVTVDGHVSQLRVQMGSGGGTVNLEGGATVDSLRLDHFHTGDAGDTLNFTDYLASHLTGWDASANPTAAGFVQLVGDGSHTLVQIDADGGGDSFTTLLRLDGRVDSLTAHNFGGQTFTVGAGDVYSGSDDVGDDHGGTRGDDKLSGGGGDDSLHGGKGGDDLNGGSGDDHLYGDDGDDTLHSGGGDDDMHGGKGSDDFVFTAADGSTVVIGDYELNKDVIDVSRIDANAAASGDQAFAFVDAFTQAAGQAVLTYDAGSNVTTAQFDANGDGAPDLTLQIAGHVPADHGWVL